MPTAVLLVLMIVIFFIAFRFFKTKGNSTYNDINFNTTLDEDSANESNKDENCDSGPNTKV